jgi:hypothetical protein
MVWCRVGCSLPLEIRRGTGRRRYRNVSSVGAHPTRIAIGWAIQKLSTANWRRLFPRSETYVHFSTAAGPSTLWAFRHSDLLSLNFWTSLARNLPQPDFWTGTIGLRWPIRQDRSFPRCVRTSAIVPRRRQLCLLVRSLQAWPPFHPVGACGRGAANPSRSRGH